MTTLRILLFVANAIAFIHDASSYFIDGFIALCVVIYVAGEFTGRAYYATARFIRAWHTDWVGTIEWTAPTPPAPPVAPFINPLMDIAAEMEQFTCKQLRTMSGCRLKTRKTALVEAIIAA